MKRIVYALFSLSVLSFIIFHIVNAKGQSETDIEKMAAILQRENIFIDQWSLYAREKLETSGEERQRALMKKYHNISWDISADGDKWEAVASLSSREDVQESIRIYSAGTESYVVYEIKGSGWNEETGELLQKIVQKKMSDIFHGNVMIFSCLKGVIDDKLDKSLGLYANDLLAAFDAHTIEKLEEASFVSTAAYTPLFTNSIKGTSKAMNLQVGLREEGLGGKTTLVVGTPIIAIEY